MTTSFLYHHGLLAFAVARAFLAVIPQGSASSFAFAVVLASLGVIPQGSASSFAVAFAIVLAFLAVVPQGSASSFAFAFASEIGPGSSPDIHPLSKAWALAPGTLPWERPA